MNNATERRYDELLDFLTRFRSQLAPLTGASPDRVHAALSQVLRILDARLQSERNLLKAETPS